MLEALAPSRLGASTEAGHAVTAISLDRDDLSQADRTKAVAQSHDVGPDLSVGEAGDLPRQGRQLLAGEGPPRVSQEEVEEVGLPPGERQRLAGVGEAVVVAV